MPVLGGLTIDQAGREIGSVRAVRQAIAAGELLVRKMGRQRLIACDIWRKWDAVHGVGQRIPPGWLTAARAAFDVNVPLQMIERWARDDDILQQRIHGVWLVNQQSVRDRARQYFGS